MCKIGSFGGHVLHRSAVHAAHLKLISVCLENNLGGFVWLLDTSRVSGCLQRLNSAYELIRISDIYWFMCSC